MSRGQAGEKDSASPVADSQCPVNEKHGQGPAFCIAVKWSSPCPSAPTCRYVSVVPGIRTKVSLQFAKLSVVLLIHARVA